MRSIVPNCGASAIRRCYFTLIRVRACVCVCMCARACLEKSHEIGGHTSMVHGVLQKREGGGGAARCDAVQRGSKR